MADFRREGSGEVEAGDVEGDDMVVRVAGDTKPGAVRSRDVPGRERKVWVVGNGGFDGNEGEGLRDGGGGTVEVEDE